jgi:hypothetical protein
MAAQLQFNSPPGWPEQVVGWKPEPGWVPDPSWPVAPAGWVFWVMAAPAGLSEESVGVTQGAAVEEAVTPVEVTPSSAETVDAASADTMHPSESVVASEKDAKQTSAALQSDAAQASIGKDQQDSIASRQRKLAELDAMIESRRGDLARSEEAAVRCAQIEATLVQLNDALLLQQVGIYEYHHPLENGDGYRERLADLNEQIRTCIREGKAILASDRFAFNNSLAQGHKMVSDFSKLMLRAYNAESDSCVRSLRAGTSDAAVKRLESASEAIAKLGRTMEMRVADEYHQLRVEEITLTSDYLMKLQEEKEDAREERERLREERKVEAELAAEREKLNKERAHYANSINSLVSQGKLEEAAELQTQLTQIDEAIAQNDYRAANIRAGYVYVISNIGAFGPNVVKIGLTRRLEPMDRIRELGDASVPFPFDVHAIYFSDDAVTLEYQLHEEFSTRRVNQVNHRREHFFATPEMVRTSLISRVGNLLEFQDIPEATQYNMSRAQWPEEQRA